MYKTRLIAGFLIAAGAATPVFATTPTFANVIAPNSQIDITGGETPVGGTNSGTATGIDFLKSGVSGTPGGTISLNAAPTGSFSSFTLAGCPMAASAGGCGTIQDIPSFTSFTPILDFFTITEGANTVSFDLNTLVVASQSQGSASMLPSLVIGGAGVFHYSGYAPTSGIFTLTTQGSGQTTFSASTVATATAIPEPATLSIVLGSLAGLTLLRRRR